MTFDKCEEREKNCNRRFEGIEKEMCTITKPEQGALSMIHEKINTRPTWTVFWAIVSLVAIVLFGSYAYTKSVSDEQKGLVTKEDFREFKKDILEEIRGLRK